MTAGYVVSRVCTGAVVSAIACAVASAGCGGSAAQSSGSATASSPTSVAPEEAASAPPAAPVPPVTVTFSQKPPVVGAARITRSWMSGSTLFAVERESAPVIVEHVGGDLDERREEIVAATDGAVTELKVTFLRKESTIVENGGEKHRIFPVAGKSYLVEAQTDGLFITTDKGRRVSPVEGEILAQGYVLGKADGDFDAVALGQLPVGQSVDGLATALETTLTRVAVGHVGFGEVTVTLRGTRDVGGVTCGVFGVHVDVAFKAEKVEDRTNLQGELVLRTTDSLPVSLSLEGRQDMAGQTSHAEINGEGHARVEVTWVDQ